MKVLSLSTKKTNEKSTSELYKELEKTNFKALGITSKGDGIRTLEQAKIQNWINHTKLSPVLKRSANEDQFAAFQRAMRILTAFGQCIGINPFIGINEKDVFKIRFTIFSWRFLYSSFIGLIQAIAAILCIYRMFRQPISIGVLAFVTFHSSTCLSTLLFMRIASKWPLLLKELYESALDEYVDPRIHIKCIVATVGLLTLALAEYILSLIAKSGQILDCNSEFADLFKKYVVRHFPWVYELKVPYSLPMGILLQFNNVISTLNWNFSDLFIVCMSLYLTSVLEQINKKIVCASHEQRFLPVIFWRSLREDYTRATSLVRSFDHVLNGIIFVSFASNLFFICLQLFNVLANGINSKFATEKVVCPHLPTSPFTGYEYSIYFIFSLALLFARSLAVSIIAASVHTAALLPAPALYNVPTSAYCDEVQRFVDQVHGDNVALSGLKFFQVTRELVLSVAGTVVTYELVLLQFNSDQLNNQS